MARLRDARWLEYLFALVSLYLASALPFVGTLQERIQQLSLVAVSVLALVIGVFLPRRSAFAVVGAPVLALSIIVPSLPAVPSAWMLVFGHHPTTAPQLGSGPAIVISGLMSLSYFGTQAAILLLCWTSSSWRVAFKHRF